MLFLFLPPDESSSIELVADLGLLEDRPDSDFTLCVHVELIEWSLRVRGRDKTGVSKFAMTGRVTGWTPEEAQIPAISSQRLILSPS